MTKIPVEYTWSCTRHLCFCLSNLFWILKQDHIRVYCFRDWWKQTRGKTAHILQSAQNYLVFFKEQIVVWTLFLLLFFSFHCFACSVDLFQRFCCFSSRITILRKVCKSEQLTCSTMTLYLQVIKCTIMVFM